MSRLLLLLFCLVALGAAYLDWVEYDWNYKSYNISQPNLRRFLVNGDKEGWTTLQRRIKKFVNKNVVASRRASAISELGVYCKFPSIPIDFMKDLVAAIKKSKAIEDSKLQEVKKLFNDIDKAQLELSLINQFNEYRWTSAYMEWLTEAQKVIPSDKWKSVNSTVTKMQAVYKEKYGNDIIFSYSETNN